MTGAAMSMPMVEKHGLRSSGATVSPSRRASVNSFSKAAFSSRPWARARSIMRRRKLRGQAPHGSSSSVIMSQYRRADRGEYGSVANVLTSGTRRISPTGPKEPSGASWSSTLKDCMATVRPMPDRRYDSRKRVWHALPRITPSLPQ